MWMLAFGFNAYLSGNSAALGLYPPNDAGTGVRILAKCLGVGGIPILEGSFFASLTAILLPARQSRLLFQHDSEN
jgi:hypothetical protein